MAHDQQSIEKPERDCRNDEQIDRDDAVGMIRERGAWLNEATRFEPGAGAAPSR
jgi:hypothetical protein